jgi:hypothetical protein
VEVRTKMPTLKIPRLGNQSVSYTWSLAKIVRKVEFKLLQLSHGANFSSMFTVSSIDCR